MNKGGDFFINMEVQTIIFWLGFSVLLVLGIGFFNLARFSFIRLRKETFDLIPENDKKRTGKWQALAQIYDRPVAFLGTIELFFLLFVVLIGGLHFHVMAVLLPADNVNRIWITALVIGISTFIIWLIDFLLARSIGLNFAIKTLNITSHVVLMGSKLLTPFVWMGENIARFILKRINVELTTEMDVSHSEEEIKQLINVSHLEGQLDEREGELIKNAFNFVGRLAREVMIPRQDMSVLYYEDSLEVMREAIKASRHTRYPLCDGDKDHIVGLVHVKHFMEVYIKGEKNLKNIISDILVIPEVMPIVDLLQLMRNKRTYLAVVVDEFGGTVGLVALEDIIEELVGDIQDEHEVEKEPSVKVLLDGGYEFDGTVLLEDVTDYLGGDFVEVDADTIGGYVFAVLERIPRVGDHVEINNWDFRVDKLDGFRILRLTAKPTPQEENAEE